MRIIVCIKQVLDATLPLEIREAQGLIEQKEPAPVYMLNPADRSALEAAMNLKQRFPATEITAVTLGPPRAEAALRTCLARGANRAVHISDDALPDYDAYTTALILSKVLQHLGYDLVLCGNKTLDGGGALVGPMLAELLDLPQVTGVVALEVDQSGRKLTAQRRLERGNRQIVECPLPALLTVDPLLAEPRYVSVCARERAAVRPIVTFDPAALGLDPEELRESGALTREIKVARPRPRTKKVFTPEANLSPAERMKLMMSDGAAQKKSSSNLLEGSPDYLAGELLRFLKERGFLSLIDTSPSLRAGSSPRLPFLPAGDG